MYLLQVCQEEVDVVDIVNLLHEGVCIPQENLRIVVVHQVHVYTMFAHYCHSFAKLQPGKKTECLNTYRKVSR